MFVCLKKNKSGSTSVQIVDKSSGKYVLFQSIGSSSDPAEIDFLVAEGKKIIASHGGQAMLPFDRDKELEFVDTFLWCLDSMNLLTHPIFHPLLFLPGLFLLEPRIHF
ncbi:hypothetical protein [Mariniflexile sp. HMF6888]|uniref:hypothetical protein n=1 Tax=Mariniflexile sp. HMF6888 TaxID=3373086 RepID=UPI0037B7B8DC